MPWDVLKKRTVLFSVFVIGRILYRIISVRGTSQNTIDDDGESQNKAKKAKGKECKLAPLVQPRRIPECA